MFRTFEPRSSRWAEGTPEHVVPYRVMEGNRPSNVLLVEILTPRLLGTLVALYEHSVFNPEPFGTSTRSTSGEWNSGRSSRSRLFPS
jgi:hypothetical protein